jgi:Short C-terminal domain
VRHLQWLAPLAELRQKNILTEEEFAVKKAELLSRL